MDIQQVLIKIWDNTNNTLLIYDAQLSQTALVEYSATRLYRSFFVNLDYQTPLDGSVLIKIFSPDRIYGIAYEPILESHYCLGAEVCLTIDDLDLAAAIHQSSELLKAHPLSY